MHKRFEKFRRACVQGSRDRNTLIKAAVTVGLFWLVIGVGIGALRHYGILGHANHSNLGRDLADRMEDMVPFEEFEDWDDVDWDLLEESEEERSDPNTRHPLDPKGALPGEIALRIASFSKHEEGAVLYWGESKPTWADVGEPQRGGLTLYAEGMFGQKPDRETAVEQLASQPGSLAAALRGDLVWRLGEIEEGRALLLVGRAGDPSDPFVVQRLSDLAQRTKNAEVASLLLDESREKLSARSTRKLAVIAGRWGLVTAEIFRIEFLEAPIPEAVVALLAGAIWFWLILGFAGNPKRYGIFIVAVLLGILSVVPTLLILIYQDEVRGMGEDGTLLGSVIYYVLGVGFREELSKLLCFAVLLPWLKRRNNLGDALVAAACVGLGFAIAENVGYFLGGVGIWSRFLTANFLHMILTGLLGFALYRALCHPRGKIENFAIEFVLVVLLHGIYDVFVSGAAGEAGGFLGIIVYAYSAWWFFGVLESHRPSRFQKISPLGIFVVGSACVIGLSINLAIWNMGLLGLMMGAAIGAEALMIFPLAFLFINQFREA